MVVVPNRMTHNPNPERHQNNTTMTPDLIKSVVSWAPLGAARFKELVEARFYDDQRFFRVLDGLYDIWIAQFGIHGDPKVSLEYIEAELPTVMMITTMKDV